MGEAWEQQFDISGFKEARKEKKTEHLPVLRH